MWIVPSSGSTSPATIRRRVLLPLPEAPSSTKSSPVWTSRLTRSTVVWSAYRFVTCSTVIDMASAPAPRRVAQQEEEDEEGQRRQHGGDGIGRGDVAGLELRKDVEGSRLRLQTQVARHQHGRSEFAERVRERQQHSAEEAAAQGRQDHPPERLPAVGADRVGGLLVGALDFVEHGLDGAEHVRERHEE